MLLNISKVSSAICISFGNDSKVLLSVKFLNQARTWFLKIESVQIIGMCVRGVCVCVFVYVCNVCVCVPAP